MKKLFLPLCALALSTSLISCKKDNDSPAPTIVGKWQLKSAVMVQEGFTIDVAPFLETCIKDNIVEYKENGTFTVDEGATKCDADDPQTSDEGSYTISADNKTLSLASQGDIATESITILELSNSTLKLDAEFEGEKATITFSKVK